MKPYNILPYISLFVLLCIPQFIQAQVSINEDNSNPNPSAMLDVSSTEKGMLIPRMTSAQRVAINGGFPATGLLVFDISSSSFWFYNGSAWKELTADTDDMGNHTATQNIRLNGNYLSGDGNNEGVFVDNNGRVGIGSNPSNPNYPLDARGGVRLLRGAKDIVFTSGNYGPSTLASTDLFFNRNNVGFNQSEFVLYNLNNNIVGNRFFQLQYTGDIRGLTIRKGGNVGVGTNLPTAALEVIGTVKANAFEGDGSLLTGIAVDDADADATNELQLLSITEDTLRLTDGGFVVLPSDKAPNTTLPIPILFQGGEIYVHPVDNASAVDWPTAQTTCDNLVAHGHSDWYLPSRLELDAMYKQSYLITGLSQTAVVKYWSDTEQDATNAFTQRLDYGGPDPDPKTDTSGHNCRCVRKD